MLEALRQEPVRFELDIPYAATDNSRQRLDMYLPKEPGSDKLPVIVFLHGGLAPGQQGRRCGPTRHIASVLSLSAVCADAAARAWPEL